MVVGSIAPLRSTPMRELLEMSLTHLKSTGTWWKHFVVARVVSLGLRRLQRGFSFTTSWGYGFMICLWRNLLLTYKMMGINGQIQKWNAVWKGSVSWVCTFLIQGWYLSPRTGTPVVGHLYRSIIVECSKSFNLSSGIVGKDLLSLNNRTFP